MIKTNELRIGNYVSINNGFEMLVHSIFQNDTVYLDFIPPLINEADVWEEDCKDLIAIPLTEEWLLKAGYKKQNGYGYSNYKIYGTILKNDNGFEFHYYGIIIRLDFVHQLQNLFFSFYGEELVFSTEP